MTMMTRQTQGAITDRHDKAVVQDRGGRRAELSCRLFFFGDDDFEGEGTLLDISTRGCRASSLIAVQPGMLLKLSVFLPDYLWPLRVDEAMVRSVNGQEFAVEFTSIRLAQRERLRALVMKEKP